VFAWNYVLKMSWNFKIILSWKFFLLCPGPGCIYTSV